MCGQIDKSCAKQKIMDGDWIAINYDDYESLKSMK